MPKSQLKPRLTFGDLVNAISDTRTRSTLEQTVSPGELAQLLRGDAVAPDVPLKILAALNWHPEQVDTLLSSLPDIPVTGQGRTAQTDSGSLSIVSNALTPTPSISSKPGKIATMLLDPVTGKLESFDTLRPDQSYVNESFITSFLAGFRWLDQFDPRFVDEVLRKLRTTSSDGVTCYSWGITSRGVPGCARFVSQSPLVRVDYSVVPTHVVPIGHRWNFATILRGRAAVSYRPGPASAPR